MKKSSNQLTNRMSYYRLIILSTFILIGVIILTSLSFNTLVAHAKPNTTSHQPTQIGLLVEPVYPKNQDKGVQGYISLTNLNKIQQDLYFKLKNASDKPITATASIVNGILSPNRTIQYVDVTRLEYSELHRSDFALTKYATLDQTQISLKAGETKKIKVKTNISNFKGTVLGGVSFSELENTKPPSNGFVGVISKKTLIYGVQLNIGKEKAVKITVGKPYVKQLTKKNFVLRVPIKFDTNRLIKGMKFIYNVKNSEGRIIFKNDKYSTFNVSPKTTVEFNVLWGGKELSLDEDYTVDIKFSDPEDNKDYTFKKLIDTTDPSLKPSFDKDPQDHSRTETDLVQKEKRVQEKDKDKQDPQIKEKTKIRTIFITSDKQLYILYLIIIVILVLIIFIMFFFLIRKKKKEKEQEEQKEQLEDPTIFTPSTNTETLEEYKDSDDSSK